MENKKNSFNVTRQPRFSDTERLLFDILEELREINGKLAQQSKEEIQEEIQEVIEDQEDQVKNKKYICKVCDKEYDSKGKQLACYSKHKRKKG